jgi:hypothetical protein
VKRSTLRIDPEKLGFDFDGVIADIGEAFIRLACNDYGYCSLRVEDLSSFQVEECLDIPGRIIDRIFDDILEDSLGIGLQPMPGAIETLRGLSRVAAITVITARPSLEPVRAWFDHYCDAETNSSIRLIATGDHDDKERYIRQCGLHHFVDDRTITCLHLAEAGLAPLVFSQPWNQGRHQLPSVEDWEQLGALLDIPAPTL